MRSSIMRWGVGGIAALVLVHVTASAAVFYVDSDAPAGGDGKSWAGAYADLGRALDVVIGGDEIRVAEGVYRPGPAGGDRALCFFIDNPIQLIGGFAGAGQPDPDARDIAAYPTILSGDLNGDDAVVLCLDDMFDEPTRQDNSYHVVSFGEYSGETVLDGFVISGGNGDGQGWYDTCGSGILGQYYQANPLIRFCTIEFNAASGSCAGAYLRGRFEDCVVRFNCAAHYGGGLGAAREITRCVIEDNACGEFGGGLVWSPRIADSMIRNNTAATGGGIAADSSGIEITNCTIENNIATGDGGGIYVSNCGTCNGFPVLYRCRIIGNKAGGNGGGYYENPSEVWLWSCEIVGNTAGNSGGGIYEGTYGYCGIVNCTVFANTASDGGGLFYQNTYSGIEGIVTNSIFWGNTDVTGTGTERAQIRLNGQPSTGYGAGDSVLSALVNHSCIQGLLFAYSESGNISTDPKFIDPYGEDNQPGTADDDLRLSEGSPCINAGDNGIYACAFGGPGGLPGTGTGTSVGTFPGEAGYSMCSRALIDLDAKARLRGGLADMGGYEVQTKPGAVIYVDDSAVGIGDGSCWGDAFTDLQDALEVVNSGQEIHVAQGIYTPADPNGNREASFQLKNGVTIKGGFAGFGASDPDLRDAKIFQTILSGDLNGDDAILDDSDQWIALNRSDNSYHVVDGSQADTTAVLEGFTISGGHADGPNSPHRYRSRGGGLYNDSGSPTVMRCRFQNNFALGGGGAIAGPYGSADTRLVDCLFVGNHSECWGGAVCGGADQIEGCVFEHNSAGIKGGAIASDARYFSNCVFRKNQAPTGGASWMSDHPGTRMVQCVFEGNLAPGGKGGGIYCECGPLALDRCSFVGNQAEWGGGMYLDNAAATIVNCTVAHNLAWDQWGGVAVEVERGAIDDPETSRFFSCIFWGNTCESDNVELAQIGRNNGNATFDFCCVQGWTGKFAGVGTIDQDPLFIHPGYWDTKGTYYYYDDVWIPGDYHLKSQGGRWDVTAKAWVKDDATSPCIDAGDPASPIMFEPFPNGGVVNMGAYGGTAEASKSYFGKPVCEVIVSGDINGDCKIDLGDFAILAGHWLESH